MQMKALQNLSKTSKQIKSDMSDFSIINSHDKYILNHLNFPLLSQLFMYIYSILAVLLRLVLILRQLTKKKVTQIETCDRVQYFLMLLINYILLYVLNKIEVFFFKQNGYFLQCRQTFVLFICLTMGFTKVVRILLMSVGNISKYISTAFMCRR